MATKNKKEQTQGIPECAADFIKQIVKKMRYRRKICREVQAELTAHFEDELKDCKSEQERKEKAGTVIAEFGDVKMLAILMRRAKKRCRPLWRTIVVRTFQAAGIFILCMVIYIGWFLSGKPEITTNYVTELNNLVRPKADDSLNAAPYYQKAIESNRELSDDFILFFAENYNDDNNEFFIQDLKDDINTLFSNKESTNFKEKRNDIQESILRVLFTLPDKNYYDFTDSQKSIIDKLIREQNEGLNYAVEGSGKPYYWPVYKSGSKDPGEMMDVVLPNVSEIRKLTQTLVWRAWIKANTGGFSEAIDDVKAVCNIGRHFRGDKTIIEQLVGFAIETRSVRAIRDMSVRYQISSEILEKIQKDMDGLFWDDNFAISYKADKLFLLDEIQRSFTSDRIGRGHLYLPRFTQLADLYHGADNGNYVDNLVEKMLVITNMYFSNHFIFTHPNKQETIRTVNEYFDILQSSAKNAIYSPRKAETINERIEKLADGNFFLNAMSPPLGRLHEISKRSSTEARATLTMIALIRYKQDEGRYPQDLNELVTSGYLRGLPVDPFSKKPFVYRREGESFILYSCGPNYEDDNGKEGRDRKGKFQLWSDEGDAVFWPVPKSDMQ